MSIKEKIESLIEELKENPADSWIVLCYEGREVASIWPDGDLDNIEINERPDHILLCNDVIHVLVNDAYIDSY